jgi:hypothetical protein
MVSLEITWSEFEAGDAALRHPPTCECGGRLGCVARSRRAKAGYRRRPKHDLCRRCYLAMLDRLKALKLKAEGRGGLAAGTRGAEDVACSSRISWPRTSTGGAH